jgi:REP element-mobilizing transposase RayT
MRPLRHLSIGPSGKAVVEVTVRTVHSRFLLLPSTLVNATILGVLARAQERYGIEVCAYAFLANHGHLYLVVSSTRQLSRFMRYLNSNVARKVGRIYGWRQKFFARRYRSIQVSDEKEAQIARLLYVLRQGVKEGLVRSPLDWPGVHCAWNLVTGNMTTEGWWHDQTAAYRARLKGEKVERGQFRSAETLVLSQIPAWAHLDPTAYRDQMRMLVELVEEDARASGRSFLGPEKVLRQNPHGTPTETKTSPAPFVHAATRAERFRLRDAYSAFLYRYRIAAKKLLNGDLTAEFPPDCFPPRFPAADHPRPPT